MIYAIIVACAIVVAVSTYAIGYCRGAKETAFEKNETGKQVFELVVCLAADVARRFPAVPLPDIADKVRNRREQLSRLTVNELLCVRQAELN